MKKGESQSLEEKDTQSPLVHIDQPPLPFSHRMILSKLDPNFARFLDVLKMTYVNVPFLEPFIEALSYIKFLRDLSKKGKLKEARMVRVGEVCSMVPQS